MVIAPRAGFSAALGAIAGVTGLQHIAVAQSPGETTVLGPFTGHYAKLHPANEKPHLLAYYGTDLGWSYEHGGQIHFLFGDTTVNEHGDPIARAALDDVFGTIPLADWPDPARIAAGSIPLIRLGQKAGSTEMAALDPGQPMESFKTPLGGFSNGSREFALFYTSKPKGCRADADCPGGLTCDTGLGFVGEPYDKPAGLTVACVDGTPACAADTMVDSAGKPIEGSGFCSDPTSSIWSQTNVGRVGGVALTQLVGIRSTTDPALYTNTRQWVTNKFANAALRASGAGANRRVLLWGRPGFIGVNARGRTMGLYFAYVDMPTGPEYSWNVHYFTGTDAKGAPQFSANEKDAVAVDLDASRAGVQATEAHDIVDQMSIVWVAHLKKWLMLYGGGMTKIPMPPLLPSCGVLEYFTGAECKDVVLGNGAIRLRTADEPWGPWSPPQDVLAGGNPDDPVPRDQYGVGGVLYHPACTRESCAPRTSSRQLSPGEYGFLYGVNIIESWIKPVGRDVDVIWNASTWDPYRVVLLRTRIRAR